MNKPFLTTNSNNSRTNTSKQRKSAAVVTKKNHQKMIVHRYTIHPYRKYKMLRGRIQSASKVTKKKTSQTRKRSPKALSQVNQVFKRQV